MVSQSKDRVRVAVIGTSDWAQAMHYTGLRARADAEIVAACGRDARRVKAVADSFCIANGFTSYEQMLDEVSPDVVVVSTPNRQHLSMTLAALEHGAHVICEKPLGLSADEARVMLRRAEETDRRHMTFFTYRGVPGLRWVKHLIDERYVGSLYHAQACFSSGSWLSPDRPASWKMFRAESGSGVLADRGVHLIDLLQWWFGPIERVVGQLSTFASRRPDGAGGSVVVDTDDVASFTAGFGDGSHAMVQVSRVAAGRHNCLRLELYGSAGMLLYENDQPFRDPGTICGVDGGAGTPCVIPLPSELEEEFSQGDPYTAIHRALSDPFFASLGRPEPGKAPSFADGLAAQRVVDAVIKSNASRKWEVV